MTVTFLVAINLDDISTLTDIGNEIQDDLEKSGHDVVSVKPWARPSTTQAISPFANLPALVEPPAQPTPPTL